MICKISNALGKNNSNNKDLKKIDHINYEYEKQARSQTNKVKTQLKGELKNLKSGDCQIVLREFLESQKREKL